MPYQRENHLSDLVPGLKEINHIPSDQLSSGEAEIIAGYNQLVLKHELMRIEADRVEGKPIDEVRKSLAYKAYEAENTLYRDIKRA